MFDCLIMVQCLVYSWLYPRILGKSMVSSWFYPITYIYIYIHIPMLYPQNATIWTLLSLFLIGHITFYPMNFQPWFQSWIGPCLVGGFKPFLFFTIYGMSSFPLTNSYFQDGYCTTNQIFLWLLITINHCYCTTKQFINLTHLKFFFTLDLQVPEIRKAIVRSSDRDRKGYPCGSWLDVMERIGETQWLPSLVI